MSDGYNQARLGNLERPASARVVQAEPAFEYLTKLGLTAPRSGLRNAIAVALIHSSYLHENKDDFPGVTAPVLEMLARLGRQFLQRFSAAESYQNSPSPTSASLSNDVAQQVSEFPAWTSGLEWLRRSAALGTGTAREALNSTITSMLARQVIGVLCIEGKEDVANKLLSEYLLTCRQTVWQNLPDPKTLLDQSLRNSDVTYEFHREGPDHDTTFRAIVRDTRQRVGEGTGRNKKAASKQAALNFLERYLPEELTRRMPANGPRQPARELPEPSMHVDVVRRVQHMFSLPETVRPLISQALIRPSWVYENKSKATRYRQQDYQVLAFLGSQVLAFEYIFAAAHLVARTSPSEFSVQTISNEICADACRETGLLPGVLMGVGERTLDVSIELSASTFQAVIGAVFVGQGLKGGLSDNWPADWASTWKLIAPCSVPSIDPTTRLQEVAALMKLELQYEFSTSGADHAKVYVASVILSSPGLDSRLKIVGSMAAGKKKAKREVSNRAIRAIDRIFDQPVPKFLESSDRPLAQLIFGHQKFILANFQVPIRRWIEAKFFGLHLVSDNSAVVNWAIDVDSMLGDVVPLSQSNNLQNAFREADQSLIDPEHTLDGALADAMDALDRIDAPEDVDSLHIQDLVQLCNICRCLGADEPNISLPEIINNWQLVHRGRPKIGTTPPNIELSGREQAVIDAALSAALRNDRGAAVEVVTDVPLRLRFSMPNSTDNDASGNAWGLWSTVSNTVAIDVAARTIDVTITKPVVPNNAGPITHSVLAALHRNPEPYRAAVADLLHDLKNQLVAARLAVSQPAEGRTARLEQQLTASRHLDQVHALALRLRAATSQLLPVSSDSIEIGSFLRQYASATLTRLPVKISLSIPEARSTVRVAIDSAALSAVLDNLMSNAIEALSDGGSIALDWTSDEYEAVIEILDNGPGLPLDIVEALASGRRVRSTKPGGNGLGLLGVQSLLSRVGGQIRIISTQSGTACLITLPVAIFPGTELE
ncbi:ATP-binding protein [Nocardia niigatensis]